MKIGYLGALCHPLSSLSPAHAFHPRHPTGSYHCAGEQQSRVQCRKGSEVHLERGYKDTHIYRLKTRL